MRLLLALLLAARLQAAPAAEPFTLSLPPDFSGPKDASFGADRSYVWIRPTDAPQSRCLFQITIAPVPEAEKSETLEARLDRLLQAAAGRRRGFTRSAAFKTTLSGHEALAADWTGEFRGQAMKGRTICAVHQGSMIHITFEDTPSAWSRTATEMEKAIAAFKAQEKPQS